jgi:hypothetical protein
VAPKQIAFQPTKEGRDHFAASALSRRYCSLGDLWRPCAIQPADEDLRPCIDLPPYAPAEDNRVYFTLYFNNTASAMLGKATELLSMVFGRGQC